MRQAGRPTQLGAQLDPDHDLGGALLHTQHPEAGQAEHRLGKAGSVGLSVRGLLLVAALVGRDDCRELLTAISRRVVGIRGGEPRRARVA
jgi:hypothetical protein